MCLKMKTDLWRCGLNRSARIDEVTNPELDFMIFLSINGNVIFGYLQNKHAVMREKTTEEEEEETTVEVKL